MHKQQGKIRTFQLSDQLGIEAIWGQNIGNTFRRHIHRTFIFGLVEQGSRNITCSEQTFFATKNEVFILNPGQIHACECSTDHCYQVLSVSPLCIHTLLMEETGSKDNERYFPDVTYKNRDVAEKIRSVFTSITEGSMHELTLQKTMEFLRYAIRELTKPQRLNGQKKLFSSPIKNACGYLQKHFAEADKVALTNLAQETLLSPFHLQRVFTEQVGVSPHGYLQAYRVAEARKRLAISKETADLAIQLGFCDQSHFSRVFRQIMGVPPRRYNNSTIHR